MGQHMHTGVREAHPCQFCNRKYVEEGEGKKDREEKESEIYQKENRLRKRIPTEQKKKKIEIQREIKSDAVKETEVVGWVRE